MKMSGSAHSEQDQERAAHRARHDHRARHLKQHIRERDHHVEARRGDTEQGVGRHVVADHHGEGSKDIDAVQRSAARRAVAQREPERACQQRTGEMPVIERQGEHLHDGELVGQHLERVVEQEEDQ